VRSRQVEVGGSGESESGEPDHIECWMFFYPGSSHPQRMILEQKPVDEFPSLQAAKAAFVDRVNGRDPKYLRVDDDAFAWVYFKESQRYGPQSKLWSMRALSDLTLKIEKAPRDSRTITMETRAETERRLGPIVARHVGRKLGETE
jgi:hypothetical protein